MIRLLFISAVLFSSSTSLAADKPKVTVVEFTGPNARTTRSHFLNQVCREVRCLRAGGDGQQVAADAVIVGEIKKGKRSSTLEVSIIGSADGRTITRKYGVSERGMLLSPATIGGSIAGAVNRTIPKAASGSKKVAARPGKSG